MKLKSKEKIGNKWIEFITQDVNNSIGNKNNHIKSKEIIKVFSKKPNELTHKDIYILETIFTESFLQAFFNFLKEAHIDYEKAKNLYFYLKDNKGIYNEKFDWFFKV
jgi:hypothetical protein